MLNQILMAAGGMYKRHQDKVREETMKVCAACGQEQVKSVNFCGKCGSDKFLLVSEFLALQGKRREASLQDLGQRRTRNQAILAIRNLEAAPYCSSCDVYFKPEHGAKHCTKCGKYIGDERMPKESMFQILQPQFPQFMLSYEDFEKLRGESLEPLVTAKLVVGAIKDAAHKLWES